FLYAESSASSSATMSFSGSMPFSRASACMASRISRDTLSVLEQVRTADFRVRDRDHVPVSGQGHLVLGGGEQLAGEAAHLRGRRAPPRSRPGTARAHARAAPDEATEV